MSATLELLDALPTAPTTGDLLYVVRGSDDHKLDYADLLGGVVADVTAAEQIRDVIAAALTAGTAITITPNDGADTITIAIDTAVVDERIRDTIAAALASVSGITITPNDGADTISFALDTAVIDERARDALGAALIGGQGITATVSDGSDTITLDVAPDIQAVASSATVTPTFADDLVKVTAQAAALALANPTGTPVPGKGMVVRIKDNGTARAISYDTQYRAIGVTLPTTTVISKTLYLGMIYNSDDTKWDVVAVRQEA